jgi:glutathione S-transferase
MKLYVTYASPYARLARILVTEKVLQNRVEIIEAKTRTPGSPYYQINPSGRVPYLIDDAGVGMEDSQLICAYLDMLDGKPRFHDIRGGDPDWPYLRLEAAARSLCDGISCGAVKCIDRRLSVHLLSWPMRLPAVSASRMPSRRGQQIH